MSITAIVLAGGKGSRMNHLDKPWVIYRNKALIHHVLDNLASGVDEIIISRNQESKEDADLGYASYADVIDNFQGPLAGIMSCAPHVTTEHTLVVPCDTPNLPADLISRLIDGKGSAEIAVASQGEKIEPLIFLADTKILGSIQTYLEGGRRSVMGWIETRAFIEVDFAGPTDIFENINKISQLQE